MNIYLSENIRRLRREKGITQENLAEFLGVTFQSVSKWERGESYPDITILPAIASFFGVTTDEVLGMDKSRLEERIREYIDFYSAMRLKDSHLTYKKLKSAVKEFPGDFRLLVRYMEMLMIEKTHKDAPDFEKTSCELMTIYRNIQNHCTDDSIRIWAKRLICQHLHTKAHYTGAEIYQQQAEEILDEIPEMLNSREYLATMLISDMPKHYKACSDAIEQLLFMLENSVSHHCFYDENFTPEYKIEAILKMNTILETIYTDGNYGKNWLPLIYNYGNLGRLYFRTGDEKKAIEYLRKSAELAKQYDSIPEKTLMNSQFFENRTFEKTLQGETMCERMTRRFTNNYSLSDDFRNSDAFRELLEIIN